MGWLFDFSCSFTVAHSKKTTMMERYITNLDVSRYYEVRKLVGSLQCTTWCDQNFRAFGKSAWFVSEIAKTETPPKSGSVELRSVFFPKMVR